MSRKISWLVLAVLVLVLVACAEEPEPTATPRPTRPTPVQEPTPVDEGPCAPTTDGPLADIDPRGGEVLWWYYFQESFEEEFLPLVAEFNEINECGIMVVTQNQDGYEDLRDKMNAGVAAKELPGLVVGDQTDQAFYAQGGGLADLDLYKDDPYWGLSEKEGVDFYASFLKQGVHPLFDSQRFGFPLSRSMELLYYNQTWLEELGFDGPPTTPQEFKEMACAGAEENGDGTGGYLLRDDGSALAAWTLAFGGSTLDETGVGFVFNSAATLRAVNLLGEMVDEGCAWSLDEGFPDPEFAGRRAIFARGSSSDLPYFAENMVEVAIDEGRATDEWGVTAIPHTTADPVQNIYGADLMIPVTTPETQLAAWIFLKWFTSPENQAEWVKIGDSLPAGVATTEFLDDYQDENPQWAMTLDLLPYGAHEPPLISYRAVSDLAAVAFKEIMQGADIRPTLAALSIEANTLQAELMGGVDLVDMDLPPVPVAEPCAPPEDGSSARLDPRDMEVVWWHSFQGDREEVLLALVEEFNSTNECGIFITAERQRGPDELNEKMLAAAASGELPGLVVGDQIDQASYARDGALADMTTYVDDAYWGLGEEDDDFYPGPLEQGVHPAFDDQRLGFPLNRSMELLVYNQTWLEDLGFDEPPATPEELEEMACAAAEENDDGTGGFILRDDAPAVAAWTMAFGGSVLDRHGTGYRFNGRATETAITWLSEMFDEGCAWVLAEGSPDAEFAARRAIFTLGSSSDILAYQTSIESAAEAHDRDPDEWGVTAIPHTTADPVQNIYGADLMIPATTPETELAAWIFLKWFTSPEIQADWVKIGDTFPTRAATTEFLDDYQDENPQWTTALDLLPFGIYEPPLISFRAVSDLVEDAFNTIMQGEDIEDTLDALTDEANELQEELMTESNED